MPKRPGRPKLKKADFKGVLIGARFAPDEAKEVETAAKRAKQGKSQWVRNSLLAAARAVSV